MILRLLLAAALLVSMASAQGKKGGSRGGGGGEGGMPPMQRQTRLDMIADKLKLNKDQKEEVAKIFDADQEKANPLNELIRNGRGKITEMLIAGKNSGADWDNLMKAFTGVLAQQQALETDAFQKLYASLEDKQKKNAPVVFEELMAGMFEAGNWRRPPMGARSGMGFPQGPGGPGGMGDGEGMGTGSGRGGR
jgi:Spy/CpxP family protein refolding chaperone